jgi:hypothetical protein
MKKTIYTNALWAIIVPICQKWSLVVCWNEPFLVLIKKLEGILIICVKIFNMKLFVSCCLTSKKQYIFITRTSLHPMINHIGNRWRCDETMNERGDNGQGRNQIFCRVAVHELSITDVCSIWLLQFVFYVQWVCCFHRTRPSLSTAHQAVFMGVHLII